MKFLLSQSTWHGRYTACIHYLVQYTCFYMYVRYYPVHCILSYHRRTCRWKLLGSVWTRGTAVCPIFPNYWKLARQDLSEDFCTTVVHAFYMRWSRPANTADKYLDGQQRQIAQRRQWWHGTVYRTRWRMKYTTNHMKEFGQKICVQFWKGGG